MKGGYIENFSKNLPPWPIINLRRLVYHRILQSLLNPDYTVYFKRES